MNQLQAFAFDSHAVRVVTKESEPWFVAKDVCLCLGIVNYRDAAGKLDEDERGVSEFPTPQGGPQNMTVVNESGLYNLVFTSRKPEAKQFKKWVTTEVLPAIRKTGGYVAPGLASRGRDLMPTLVSLIERSEAREERLMLWMERLLPTPGKTRRKGKAMHVADMERIKVMRATGATLEDIVAATGFSQTQVSYVLGDQVRIKPDGRVVTVHRYTQALAQQKTHKETGGGA